MNSILKLPVKGHLDIVLNYGEIQLVIGCLNRRKAADEFGILPELLMSRGPVIVDRLMKLCALDGEVDVLLGTGAMLSLCQYLRKVILSSLIIRRRNSLLDVVGKVLGKIIHEAGGRGCST